MEFFYWGVFDYARVRTAHFLAEDFGFRDLVRWSCNGFFYFNFGSELRRRGIGTASDIHLFH